MKDHEIELNCEKVKMLFVIHAIIIGSLFPHAIDNHWISLLFLM